MKYIIVLGDGMPDYPVKELQGKTPLQYARTPNMDMLARHGKVGMLKTVPDDMPPGSDVANLTVMGYDPTRCYTGRSPLEAVAMGVELGSDDVAFRCNLVALSEEEAYEKKKMLDYSADEITSGEAKLLIEDISKELGDDFFHFYAGVSYRHLVVWKNGLENFTLTPPHDIPGKEIGPFLPRGDKSTVLLQFMEKSHYLLKDHRVNRERQARGLRPANSIWLWGQGRRPSLDSFEEKYGLEGAVISAVDLIKGIGICAGLEAVNVEGATGNINTNFRGKALKAVSKLMEGREFIYIHVEAPDEAGHRGELDVKVRAIEEIDEKVVGELLRGMDSFPHYRLMVLSDHPTPLSLRTHTREAVPFVIYDKGAPQRDPEGSFSEEYAHGGLFIEEGYRLMDLFTGKITSI